MSGEKRAPAVGTPRLSTDIILSGLDNSLLPELSVILGVGNDSIADGRLARLDEHPLRISIYGDMVLATFTVVKALDPSVLSGFLSKVAK